MAILHGFDRFASMNNVATLEPIPSDVDASGTLTRVESSKVGTNKPILMYVNHIVVLVSCGEEKGHKYTTLGLLHPLD